MSKKRRIRKSFIDAFIFLIIALLIGAFFLFKSYRLTPKANTIFIYDLLEDKEVYYSRNQSYSKAYKGMRLIEGDELYTSSNSKVFLKLDDNKNVLLDYDSQISIEKYNDNQLIIKLNKGQFFFDVTSKLAVNEKMSFKIANTTMSIRGTSGAGKNMDGDGKLMIFTGVGEIENNDNSIISLMPNTKVSFNSYQGDSIVASMVYEKDVPSVMKDYLQYSNEYIEELNEHHWNETIPPYNLEGSDYIGWRQNEDGTWYFDQNDYNNHIGPTYYRIDKPVNLVVEDSIYNGQIQDPIIHGYNENFMIIEGGKKTDAGTYDIAIRPRSSWSNGSKDAVYLKWTIHQKEIEINIEDARKEYKSSDPEFKSSILSGEIDIQYKLVREKGEELGSYTIYPEYDEFKNPNYKIKYNDAKLVIYTTFTIEAKQANYDYRYDGFYNGPDDPIKASDEKDTSILYSLDKTNWVSEPIKLIQSGSHTIYAKAINNRYDYNPECSYNITINPSVVEAKATGYRNQKSIDLIAEVQVPPGVEYTASYYLYEINDFNLNRDRATLISRIVANGTYIAYPQIKILDTNFIPEIKYTKVTVTSMRFYLFKNEYYDDINSILLSYTPE